jgi:hypothetical protein
LKSQLKYGKATSVLVSKVPSYGKFANDFIGYAPTAEQLKGKKPQFKLGGFKFGKY